jgi:hypothetical protein
MFFVNIILLFPPRKLNEWENLKKSEFQLFSIYYFVVNRFRLSWKILKFFNINRFAGGVKL